MRSLFVLLGAGVCLLVGSAPTALACGGCFVSVSGSGAPSVVQAHRMAVAFTGGETILWDQFEYVGEPEGFVWVLPVAGGQAVHIELSSNAFFQYLRAASPVTLTGPVRALPPLTPSGGSGCGFGCQADDSAGGGLTMPSRPPVTVYSQAVVGPYETAIIGSESSESLLSWLEDHDYNVPEEIIPIIDQYTAEGMNFAVLRLAPGEAVQRMQPVRVRTPGTNVAFPLRMVAAGITDSVGLELFVIGEGRYQVAGFENATIHPEEIIYDWGSSTYNYDALATDALRANRGRVWLTEYAHSPDHTAAIRQFQRGGFDLGDSDAESPLDVATDEWRRMSDTIRSPVLTRMRARLNKADLTMDLVLEASTERGFIGGQIEVTRDIGWDDEFGPAVANPDAGPSGSSIPLPLMVLGALVAGQIMRRRRA